MYQYLVRVRGGVYLWGSDDIDIPLASALALVVNNDAFGDLIELASEAPQGAPVALGTLQPGQCWTVALTGLRGVTATCATDTTVSCAILPLG